MLDDAPRSKVRRLGFALVSLMCCLTSISLLYELVLLQLAAGSRAFLYVPRTDPRPAAGLAELALVILQLTGGVTLAISSVSVQNIRRSLKWSPLFIIAFAALTWVAALAARTLRG
jgi:hypothetical protein